MAIFFPDILENNNTNYPLVDATSLKGTAYPLASINSTGSIPSDKRNVGTIVFDSGSGKFYGFKGSSVSTWNTPSNWIEFGSGTGGSTDLTPLNNFTASASTRLDSLEAATGSYVTNAKTGSFLYSGSYDSTTSALTLYSKATNYTLDLSGLAGGSGGFAITASNEGTVLTENARTFDFVGNGVTATNIGSAVTVTVNTGSGATTNTGSLMITGSVNSNVLTFTKGDGSTFNLTVNTGSASVGTTNTGSLLVTGSVSNATITFTKGDGSTFPLTINNVNNAVSASFATTASYVLNAVSASFAPNIYNSDGTLTGNRTVDLNGESLTFIANEGESFRISSSISSDVTITGLPQASQSMVIGYNFSNGQLTAMNTSSFGGGTVNTGSLLVTGSVSNATLTFTKGNGSTFPLTINNVNNAVSASFATTASYVLNAVSASFAPNLYNSNGVLTGTRTVDLNGESLTFLADGGESFIIASNPASDVSITNLAQASQSMVIGYNFSNGRLTAMNTSSFGGGGTVNTGSLLVTGSVSNATLTFTKGNGSTFPLTVNNVANATTAGSVNSYSVYAEAGTDFNIWTDAGSTFTLLNVNGANIQAVAPKTTEASSRILAIATMEVFRSSSAANHTAFQYRMYNSTQAVAVAGSTREFSSYLSSGAEGTFATTFTFTVPISSDVTSGDTIELQVRKNPSAPLGTYSSASISYADLALVNITE